MHEHVCSNQYTLCILVAQACFATCYQRYVIERCGCADSQYPMEGAAFDYKRVSACNSNNATEG